MFDQLDKDLQMLREDHTTFPRQFATSSLQEILKREDIDGFLANIAQRELTIRKHGIQIFSIFPTNNEDGPAFNYSVGCDRVGLPELLTFYPSHKSAHWVFNMLYQKMLDCKIVPPSVPGEVMKLNGILDGDLEVALVLLTEDQRVDAYEKFTCQCESADVPVLHVLMPMPNGTWIDSFIPDKFKVPGVES